MWHQSPGETSTRAARTASATAASLIADTLRPSSRAAARLATVRVMLVRRFSVVVCIVAFSLMC